MKAEFRSEDMADLPAIVLSASDETEWRAMQLWMRLMNMGLVRLTAEYNPNPEAKDV